MKLNKKFLLFALTGVICFNAGVYVRMANIQKYNLEEEQIKQEKLLTEKMDSGKLNVDLEKVKIQNQIKKSQTFVDTMNSKVELQLLEIQNSYRTTVDKNLERHWFCDSSLVMQMDYRAKLCIPTDSIHMQVDDKGMVIVSYDIQNIKCDGITVDDYAIDYDVQLFGKQFTKEETLAIIESGNDEIVKSINENLDYKVIANNNLIDYIRNMATSLGVKEIYFKNTGVVEKLNFQ